jgi:hypothetical protein
MEALHDLLWLLLAALATVVLMILGRRYDMGPWSSAVDAATGAA